MISNFWPTNSVIHEHQGKLRVSLVESDERANPPVERGEEGGNMGAGVDRRPLEICEGRVGRS